MWLSCLWKLLLTVPMFGKIKWWNPNTHCYCGPPWKQVCLLPWSQRETESGSRWRKCLKSGTSKETLLPLIACWERKSLTCTDIIACCKTEVQLKKGDILNCRTAKMDEIWRINCCCWILILFPRQRERIFSLDLYDLSLPMFSQKMSMATGRFALVWLNKNNKAACYDKHIGFNDENEMWNWEHSL